MQSKATFALAVGILLGIFLPTVLAAVVVLLLFAVSLAAD